MRAPWCSPERTVLSFWGRVAEGPPPQHVRVPRSAVRAALLRPRRPAGPRPAAEAHCRRAHRGNSRASARRDGRPVRAIRPVPLVAAYAGPRGIGPAAVAAAHLRAGHPRGTAGRDRVSAIGRRDLDRPHHQRPPLAADVTAPQFEVREVRRDAEPHPRATHPSRLVELVFEDQTTVHRLWAVVDTGRWSQSAQERSRPRHERSCLGIPGTPLANLSLRGVSDLLADAVRCRVSARGQHLVTLAVRLVERHVWRRCVCRAA